MISYLRVNNTRAISLLASTYLKVHLEQPISPLDKKSRANVEMESRKPLLLGLLHVSASSQSNFS